MTPPFRSNAEGTYLRLVFSKSVKTTLIISSLQIGTATSTTIFFPYVLYDYCGCLRLALENRSASNGYKLNLKFPLIYVSHFSAFANGN